jgi:2-polyprenyl-6-methoxyphenol hydroxylase-like FAD-dependent oxidoreductase
MCAVMLKYHGYNVTILEQETSPSRQGYDAGISIGPAVREFMEKHDRVKREMVITCPPGVNISLNGGPKPRRDQTMFNMSWDLLVSVLRANFDGLASNAVPVAPEPQGVDGKATFRFGTRVTGVEHLEGKVSVQFEDSQGGLTQTLSAGLAIVADGSNSSIRAPGWQAGILRLHVLARNCARGSNRWEMEQSLR